MTEFYELKKVVIPDVEPGEFRLVTAAIRNCNLCGRTISGMGGPGESVCTSCGDLLKQGKLIGAVKYDDS